MTPRTAPGPFAMGVGGVVSADIAVPEHERELAFYASVLTTGAAPLWRDDLSTHHGTPVIGLGARTPEYDALPLQWMPHLQVADVAASAARALELGGRELMHGRDADGASQWAVLVDPAGAAFGVIPAQPDDDAAPSEHVGHIASLDLVVDDVQAASAFYQRVVGWTVTTDPRELRRDGDVVAAKLHARSDDDAELATTWLLGLAVGDLEESLRRVRAGGGAVLRERTRAGVASAIVRDPVGVLFVLEDARGA